MEELYITKKQVVAELAGYLSPYLLQGGFKFLKSKDAFVKKTDFGHYRIYFTIINFWPLKQNYTISITCRYICIQKILTQIDNLFDNSETAYEWLVLPNSNELQYKELYTSNDIELAKKESLLLIKDEAPKYFEKWSSLQKMVEYYKDYYTTPPDGIAANMNNLLKLLICLKLTGNQLEYNRFITELKSKVYDLKTRDQEEYYEKALAVLESIEPLK